MSEREADSWPDRIALPGLEEVVKKLRWYDECLCMEFPAQNEARSHVAAAIDSLGKACTALRSRP